MKLHRNPWHWAAASAVVAVALLTLSDAHGQSTSSNAVFQGRPAMAGAQSGLGPMSGPPQGGISPQTTEDPGGGVQLRRQGSDAGPSVPRDPGLATPSSGEGLKPQRDRDPGNVIRRDRDSGASDTGRATGKAKRAGKRSLERARRGVSGVDS